MRRARVMGKAGKCQCAWRPLLDRNGVESVSGRSAIAACFKSTPKPRDIAQEISCCRQSSLAENDRSCCTL